MDAVQGKQDKQIPVDSNEALESCNNSQEDDELLERFAIEFFSKENPEYVQVMKKAGLVIKKK